MHAHAYVTLWCNNSRYNFLWNHWLFSHKTVMLTIVGVAVTHRDITEYVTDNMMLRYNKRLFLQITYLVHI